MWKTIDRISDPEGFVEKHVFTADSAVVESVLYRYPTYAELVQDLLVFLSKSADWRS